MRGADASEREPWHSRPRSGSQLLGLFLGFSATGPVWPGPGGVVPASVWGRCRRLVGVFGLRAGVGGASMPCRFAPGAAAATGLRFQAIAVSGFSCPNRFIHSTTNSSNAPNHLLVGHLKH